MSDTNAKQYHIPKHTRNEMNSQHSSTHRRLMEPKLGTKRSFQTLAQESITDSTSIAIGPHHPGFRQHLIDNNILPPFYEYPTGGSPKPPQNMDEIRQALEKPVKSLSPSAFSDRDFTEFVDLDASTEDKRAILSCLVPIIQGDAKDKKDVAGPIQFTNLKPLTDGRLVPGEPDFYCGSQPELLYNTARQLLNQYVQPSVQDGLVVAPIVPNFLLQAPGLDDSFQQAIRRAIYDGALAARGIHRLQSYMMSGVKYDSKAYTLSSVYCGGQLKMYTIHPIPPAKGHTEPGFVMTHIKTWLMTQDADTFRQGAAAFRNGIEWAKRQRDEVIKKANANGPLDPRDLSDASSDEMPQPSGMLGNPPRRPGRPVSDM
ncbi:hypothetical protein E4U43_000429 [Claviceps pusilla]|uniref:Uncharacterized protein n=1 Tax=Claviceps pusilla TaxID=123648 RepID=A0A9P7T060_9HYPO|nr:hypothetical protein E4U43_000429 [Claviceps pusilla]